MHTFPSAWLGSTVVPARGLGGNGYCEQPQQVSVAGLEGLHLRALCACEFPVHSAVPDNEICFHTFSCYWVKVVLEN